MDWSLPGFSVFCSRQEYWSSLPLSSPGALPDPGIKPTSPVLVGIKPASPVLVGRFFTTEPPMNWIFQKVAWSNRHCLFWNTNAILFRWILLCESSSSQIFNIHLPPSDLYIHVLFSFGYSPQNPMDKGASWATVHRIAKSGTRLKRLSTHTRTASTSCSDLTHTI